MLAEHEPSDGRPVSQLDEPTGDLTPEPHGVVVGTGPDHAMAPKAAREHIDAQLDGVALDDHDLVAPGSALQHCGVLLEHRQVGGRDRGPVGGGRGVPRRSRTGAHDDDVCLDGVVIQHRLHPGGSGGIGIEQVDPQAEHPGLAGPSATADKLEPFVLGEQVGGQDLGGHGSTDGPARTDHRDVHDVHGKGPPGPGRSARSPERCTPHVGEPWSDGLPRAVGHDVLAFPRDRQAATVERAREDRCTTPTAAA